MITALWHGLCDLVYPPICPVCAKYSAEPHPHKDCCPAFQQFIRFNHPPFCAKCMRHIHRRGTHNQNCICQKQNPDFDFAWCACHFHGRLRELIHGFKYRQKTGLRKLFGYCMQEFLTHYKLDIDQFDLLMPIPLFPSKHRERGYNQAELLALEIKKKYNINISKNNLIKKKNTQNHAQLDKKERFTNIQGAFKIRHPDGVCGKSILLIDDLLTTGATASEAAKTLKLNGAKQVGVFCLAIAT